MTSQLKVSIGQSSDKGIKETNEDSYGVVQPNDSLLNSKGICAIIADGMGSCAYPKEASEYCVKGFFSD
ncbi:MAG: bifunctional protein-serine/threonine kinase/phosphatase, partial [Gammaproteobacteria bacterium]|nr:bifunctional protein-serine/threonine kinase/phosphatase [Gammaproteobacteria bacterium]